ncbi:MAG: hypothetical protein NVSMB63_09930 [Sediminibacterium sp.]
MAAGNGAAVSFFTGELWEPQAIINKENIGTIIKRNIISGVYTKTANIGSGNSAANLSGKLTLWC